MAYETLCMNCMKDRGNKAQCPHCHFHTDTPQNAPFLPYRTILQNQYLVGAVTESTGDGVTYMAYDLEAKTPVTLREYHPNRIATRRPGDLNLYPRSGRETEYAVLKDKFTHLWSTLYQMQNITSLVRTLDVFNDNNTVYAVSEYVEARVSLRDYLLESKDGYLSWKNARPMFMPLLSGLNALHDAGIVHRGISPTTVYVYPDNKLHIGGFAIAEARMQGSGLSTEFFPGYTPVEQLGLQASTGPWTDIYAFGAILYRALIGKAPIESNIRIEQDDMMIPAQFVETLPTYVIDGLADALQVYPEDRIRNTEQLRLVLSDSQVSELKSEYRKEEKERKRQMLEEARAREAAAERARQQMLDEEEEEEEASRAEEKAAKKSKKKKSGGNTGIIVMVVAILVALIAFGAIMFGMFRDHITGLDIDGDEETTATTVSEKIEVPNFVGKNASELDSSYGDSFDLEYEYETSSSVQKGYVIKQSVKAGSSVNKGSSITLTVSGGAEQITMPEGLVGTTAEDAEAKLTSAGFQVQRVEKYNDGSHNAGEVVSTSLTGGKQYDKGTTCVLSVWGEAETTTEAATTEASFDPFNDIFGGDQDNSDVE